MRPEGRVLLEASVDHDDGGSNEATPSLLTRDSAWVPEDRRRVLARRAGDGESARRRAGADLVDPESLCRRYRGNSQCDQSNDCEVPRESVPLHFHPPVFPVRAPISYEAAVSGEG